ncbi:hypothetical protein LUZ60_008868 [Juncus effusus]|nr:hypothetical protein LUZ60_008868 [Juncus effusus]
MARSQLGGNEALSKIPSFFKVLFPNPSADLRVPPDFHTYLPHKLPKQATLSVQGGTNWPVEVHRNDQDIFFRTGWSEFAKAHDLRTGYFLIFRYKGNMVFNIIIFDTTCCDKEYAQPPVMQSSHSTEIEDSSESSDETLSVKSYDSETEISSDSLNKRKKLSNGKAERVLEKGKSSISQKTIRKRKTVEISPEQSLSEKSSGEMETSTNSIGVKWKANGKAKLKFRKENNPSLQQKERKKTVKIIQDSTDCRQFEKILNLSALKHNELNMPKNFFIKNGLAKKQTFFLKSTKDGVPWKMHFSLREYQVRVYKGWSEFAKEEDLKIGDHLSFKLISSDTFLVNVVSKTSESESRSTIRQKVVDKQQVSKTSKTESRSKIRQKRIVDKKEIPFKKNNVEGEISTIMKDYNRNYMYFAKSFCVKNKLTLGRDMILKDLKGKEWLANFSFDGQQHGRLSSGGWKKFWTENGLTEGDKCIFKLINEVTMLVHIIKSEQE